MPPVVIGAAIAATGAVGAAAISSRQQRKAAASAEQLAREQQEEARTERQRLEERYGLQPGELEAFEARAGVPGEELLGRAGPITRGLLEEVGRPAPAWAESELELAIQKAKQETVRRGMTPTAISGDIGLEAMGRAGIDYAIKSARERLSMRAQVGEAALREQEQARFELERTKARGAGLATEAYRVTAPGVAAGYAGQQEAIGVRGGIVGPAEAGLGALGEIGAMIATGVPKKETLTGIRAEEYDPIESLSAFSGREMLQKRYQEAPYW